MKIIPICLAFELVLLLGMVGPAWSQPDSLATESRQSLARLHFELADHYFDLLRGGDDDIPGAYDLVLQNFRKGLEWNPDDLYYRNRLAYAYHLQRRLLEASAEYDRLLKLDPPRQLTPEEFDLVLKLAPRLFVNPREFFELEDVVAIVHPDKPLIEYSLFWDDDIDFPEDNDPTDHEKVWIEYTPSTREVVAVYTYFHHAILSTPEAVEEARAHEQRARINIQWGGHGSLPVGWETIRPAKFTVKYRHLPASNSIKGMRARYESHRDSIRKPQHPLAHAWPRRFAGTWEEYTRFSKPIDTRKLLEARRMAMKSRWPNAVIDQYFLDYQFYPKIDWPDSVP